MHSEKLILAAFGGRVHSFITDRAASALKATSPKVRAARGAGLAHQAAQRGSSTMQTGPHEEVSRSPEASCAEEVQAGGAGARRG